MTSTCPWCSAVRNTGPTCPNCGANYAKAEAIKAHGRAATAANDPEPRMPASAGEVPSADDAPQSEWKEVYDPELEWKFCMGAIPIALCLAALFHASGLGSSLQRIFLTMPVHEFGHALIAWFCGFTAIPTLWKTLVPETRGFIAPLALFGAIAYMVYRARLANRAPYVYAGGALILLQVVATLGISPDTARMLITFGGDGAGMILATLLMGSFFFGKNTQLYKGWLRWGFLIIGAVAYFDISATWWKALKDESAVPYGTTGGMATDSMQLIDVYGWSVQTLIHRYVFLSACCIVALALVYAWGVWRAKTEMEARRLAEKLAERALRKRDGI